MRNIVTAVKGLRAFVAIVRNTKDLEQIFAMHDALVRPEFLDPVISDFRESEDGRTAFRLLRRLPPWDLKMLESLPEGTLGRQFAAHMRGAGLDPAALPTLPAKNEYEYVPAHLYETHDLWHALTGFAPDDAGELGLQAFYLGQFRSSLALAILSAGLLNTVLHAMHERVERMDAIALGWKMGREAKPIFGIDWAGLLDQPIDDVRRRYRIVPFSGFQGDGLNTNVLRPSATNVMPQLPHG